MAIKYGHRLQVATFYAFALLLLTFLGTYIGVTGINLIADTEVFSPIGIPLFAAGIMFFLTFGIAQSETVDAKKAEP